MALIEKQVDENAIKKRWWQMLVINLATTRPGRWLVLKITTPLDCWLARKTKSRFTFARLAGVPLVLLTAKGAKSGLSRTVPVIYRRLGDEIVVIASKLGSRKHPAWYHNIKVHPQVSLYLEGEEGIYTAREAEGEEREMLWRKMVEIYPGFEKYQQKAGERRIPVMVFRRVNMPD